MKMASSLVVLKFETPEGADKGLQLAQSLQKQQLLQLLDAATVVWPKGKKKPKTQHLGDMTCAGAWDGAFWGMLFGLIFFAPLLGAAFGAAVGALSGHFADYGIGKDFIEQVRGKVKEGTSALFLLLGQVTPDRVVEAFKAAPKFEVIASNLSHEQEEKLKAAFATA
jgi:uncharacterized membrane protein